VSGARRVLPDVRGDHRPDAGGPVLLAVQRSWFECISQLNALHLGLGVPGDPVVTEVGIYNTRVHVMGRFALCRKLFPLSVK
jgi:hypothetical protein